MTFSNGLIAQDNAVVIRKTYGDHLVFPVIFCNDSIRLDFWNKNIPELSFISSDFTLYRIMDSIAIDSIAKALKNELDYYNKYNVKDSFRRLGLYEILYIKNSKVVWRDTLHHFNLLQLVLYRAAIDLYPDKHLYNEISYIFFRFLAFNTRPPRIYVRDK